MFFLGERFEVRNSAADVEPVPGHAARGPRETDPLFRSVTQRVLLRQEQAELRRDIILLSKRRTPQTTSERSFRRLLGGDQVLRIRRAGYQQIQVKKYIEFFFVNHNFCIFKAYKKFK